MLETDASSQPTASSPWGLLLWPFLTTLGLLLFAAVVRAAPCWVVPLLVALLANPLWLSARESFLFKRRALLAGSTYETAPARRLLWSGNLSVALRVIPAVVLAVLLLAMSTRLSAPQWGILILDALFVTGLYRLFQHQAASQVKPEMLGVCVRSWPLRLVNLGLLTLAFFVLDFFLVGAPDLRHDTWQAVAERAFADERQGFACGWISWLVGGLGAFEQGSWALAQRHIPTLPASGLRLVAWALFLLQLSLLSFIFTRLLLGVLTLVEGRAIRAESLTGESALGKTFVLTILVLALPVLYAALQLRDFDPSDLRSPAPAVLNWIDPCRAQAQASTLNARVQAREAVIIRETERRVARELDLLCAPVEAAVDDYLDWYFTVAGEYERLAALVAGDFAQLMSEQLETHLFESTHFHARLSTIDTALREDALKQIADVSQGVHDDLLARIRDHPCTQSAFDIAHLGHLEHDVWRAGMAGTTGVAVGVITAALISKKVVASVVAKVAAKKSVQAATAMLAKFAAKKGGGALAAAAGGAAVCSPAGPVAVVCGVAAGVATWLAVDKAAIEIDEAVSRADMRTEILSVLAEEKAALQTQLIERHNALIAALTEDIQTTVDGVFIPARDGL